MSLWRRVRRRSRGCLPTGTVCDQCRLVCDVCAVVAVVCTYHEHFGKILEWYVLYRNTQAVG